MDAKHVFFQSVLNHVPAAVAVIRGSDLKLISANAAYTAIAPDKEFIDKTLEEIWPETGRKFSYLCKQVLETGEPFHAEDDIFMIRRAPAGHLERAFFSWSLYKIWLPEENEWGILNTAQETTRYKEAEHSLKLSEERYRLVNEATNDIIWDWDLTTDEVSWNDAVEKALGQTRENMPDSVQSWYEHIHPDDRQRVVAGIHKAIDEGEKSWSDEYRFGPVGGPYRTYLDRGVIARESGGRAYRMIGSMLDLTERRASEHALRESEERFRSVFEQAAVGIGRVRFEDATWIDVNDAFCKMLGYKREEFLSTPWPEITHPEDVDLDLIPFKKMAAGELESYSVEKRFIHKDGRHVWAKLTLSLVRDSEGRPDYEVAVIEDISRRKEAETMLRRYEILALQSRDIILVIDPKDGRITEANAAAVEAYGYTRSELLEMTVHDLRLDHTRMVNGQMSDAASQGILFETEHRRKDGAVFPVEVSSQGAAIDGQMILVSVIRDITQRKRTEEELRKSENRFREAFATAPVGMAIMDLHGKYQVVNKAYCDLIGYDENELTQKGMTFKDVTHSEDIPANTEAFANVLAGEIPAHYLEKRYVCKDGQIIWVRVGISLRKDAAGEPHQFVKIIENIDDRKKAEAALRESEVQFRESFEHAPVGMAITDVEGHFIEANEAYCNIVGYDENELIESGVTYKDMTHPDDLDSNLAVMHRMLRGEIPAFYYEKRYVRKDRNVVWVRASVTARRNEYGEPYQLVAIVEDINDRKNAQAQQERLLNSLKKKTEEMERFAGIIRHDFGNSVFSIEAFKFELERICSTIIEQLKEPDFSPDDKAVMIEMLEDTAPTSLNYIQASVDQMKAYLKGLRQIAAVGRVTLNKERINVEELVEELVGVLKHRLEEENVQLEINELPECIADADQLKHVFMNLVTNSVKYKDDQKQPHVYVSGEKRGGQSVYCVQDNGIGIKPENHEKIFDVFYREETSKADGEGLGLSIVSRAVDRMGGSIWVESEPGQGSRFYVSLPSA
ncbi:Phytochrome-like protein cph1 [Anaerohalosphaera lusitana]|uniref:histidine kinase n=1 Tax=Anaerohalosphaera lusitana TaxID=1936003 RepID=A0A1U9NH18_9BACT|nr:PAS domain S-box protein [Anaerohalosphaera lusitana]AQT67034.1 Phytochrome-like protein cph1 [Anaerohalosphaera lusitana]